MQLTSSHVSILLHRKPASGFDLTISVAGLPTTQAFNMGVGFLAVGFVGTCLSWLLLVHFGRRSIYNYGLATLAVLQLIIGIIDCSPHYDQRPSIAWTEAVIMVIWNFIYDLTIGPVCFVLLCEVSATRVRSKTIALATAAQALAGIVMTVREEPRSKRVY